MKRIAMLSALVIMGLGSAASAQTLAEKAAWKKAETAIAEYATATNTNCGAKIAFEVDKKTVKGEDVAQASNFMWAATEAFDTVCRNVEGAKDEVKKVKTVRMVKGAKQTFEFNKEKTVLTYTTDMQGGSATPRDALATWLPTQL